MGSRCRSVSNLLEEMKFRERGLVPVAGTNQPIDDPRP